MALSMFANIFVAIFGIVLWCVSDSSSQLSIAHLICAAMNTLIALYAWLCYRYDGQVKYDP